MYTYPDADERHVNVADARRELPTLLREVSQGGGPYTIGPRGKASAVLLGAAEYEALLRRAQAAPQTELPASGWSALRLHAAGSPAELDADLDRLRQERAGRLESLAASTAPRGASKPSARRRKRP